MAIYHLSIKIISRGKGRSAVAAAAYRAGEKIINEYDGIIHDYTRKGGIAHTEILLPEHAPPEYADRATLWNAVEKIEKNKNAQLAREIEIALPVELSAGQNFSLVRDYCQRYFVSAGMCADICIHDKGDGNPHVHVMLTMRPIAADGSWAAKSKKEYILNDNGERILSPSGAFKTRKVDAVDWNDQGKAEQWRAGWGDAVNAALEQNGVSERIDHRSYERQGMERIPTVHMGVAAFQMEKRGIRTQRGDINRRVQLDNKMLRQLRSRISKLKSGLDESLAAVGSLSIPSYPIPYINLVDILTGILEKPEEKTRYQKIADLKTVAKAIAFLQQHGIADMSGLRDKVEEMRGRQGAVSDRLKKVERRMKTLDEHILHAENYFKHRDIYREYKQQKPNKQDAFYQLHHAEIILYEAAERYLHRVMNGRASIPLKSWRAESAFLVAEKQSLYREYSRLKEEVREAEVIRKSVEKVMRMGSLSDHVWVHEVQR